MTVIEIRTLEIISRKLPEITRELKRIADILESNKQPKNKCCLCGNEIIGYGNNANPISDGRCCDKCNIDKVIPERIRLMKGDK